MKTKVKKKTFIGDTFEQVSDTGTSTVKQVGKAVQTTFDPLQALDQENDIALDNKTDENVKSEVENNKNHTPVDLEQLKNNYNDQDKLQEEAARQRLFKMVKEGEREAYDLKKKKEEKRKNKEEEEKDQKKKKKEEERKKQDETSLPKGKQRRSIFSPKKKARLQHAEYKPQSGQG
ncbi:hypothetical protein A3G67_03365 [Candidatus Roizmanbacteria bacterium RIFCSPLOWO2_12_FULL_40_12]|uniref:Uncharacterized protein n=1 Tax=Candidatus Roizmanbacteria bacterium RIFCSPLOWO2_01_FULL_40_42 TaxID=1802066 RepID=A0A1F7J5H3_9BACT|nr:MAG: hypothetical protein A2779_03000 [Candidatus Roizmanbacteria bacterium RIFCSPHIGHO2_01_FULL_40_98]OGK28309.1 MAG: hypothetical protein A3C31_00365 [Candidatus Roizmanbacteria bacterium RIFCSPHIGHO2_02_FULL_40_53]OGK30545.1 MAG: hypothetical protein A2W49_03050 [Candidatus Roizmanbacteria bacterium RIFCSPHIGHO2_12_41_18]OGK36959.1 MAG: hypothetical protein A3E69_00625 [Candidatus Roizmanbacteria bacterium RIFCSPHIGHO2_12_FULL_40_130]OGK50865.1 MAG: hypothetical protein A3B50_01135 [Candi